MISGYQGQSTHATKVGNLGPLNNMLHVPSAEQTLVSAGCVLDGMTPDTALVIKRGEAFRFPSITITKDKSGRAFCQAGTDPGIAIAERTGPGAVYRIMDIQRLHPQQPDILQRCIEHVSALSLSHKTSTDNATHCCSKRCKHPRVSKRSPYQHQNWHLQHRRKPFNSEGCTEPTDTPHPSTSGGRWHAVV